jgi:hypothetical protein
MTTHNFCFYLQNRPIQTSQTGPPLVFHGSYLCLLVCTAEFPQESLGHYNKPYLCLYLEKVAVPPGNTILMKPDYHVSLIVSDPQVILDKQLRPRPIHLITIVSIFIFNNYIKI